MTLPAILVGGQASMLAAARGLGRAGIHVIAVGDARTAPARRSRWCARFLHVPNGEGVHERWLEVLLRLERGVVLPATDEALQLVVTERHALAAHGHVIYQANDKMALAMLDKHQIYGLAADAGIRTPMTVPVGSETALVDAGAAVGYPCALKPLHPIEFRRRYGFRRKLFVARDLDALRAAFRETAGLAMAVTEIIPGPDNEVWTYIAHVGQDGQPIYRFTKRKLRQWPPHFGIGSYHRSEWNEAVAVEGDRFIRALHIRGFAAVEFKRDARDGRLVLIECNQRFNNGLELLHAAGINAALVAYRIASGERQPLATGFRVGVRLLFLVEDTRSFVELRRAGELSTGAWLRSLLHRQRFPVFSVDDPLPSVYTNAALVAGILRRRLSGLAARAPGRRAP
jgi:D-aspartate ligase